SRSSLPLEPYTRMNIDAAAVRQAAKAAGQTVTQHLLAQLWPKIACQAAVRIIVSRDGEVGDETKVIAGNHFVPVDVPVAVLEAMLTKPQDQWKKLMARFTDRATRNMAAATTDF